MSRSASASIPTSSGRRGRGLTDNKVKDLAMKKDVKNICVSSKTNIRAKSSCRPLYSTDVGGPSKGGMEVSSGHCHGVDLNALVLQRIVIAQDQGLTKLGKDGTLKRTCPPFSVAYEEVREGLKQSHWIWYVWPSLSAVRGSMHPEFLLPGFEAVRGYLQHPLLLERLLQVSSLACEHLENGIASSVLFGKMHHCDFPKFYEAMSMFALQAHLLGELHQRSFFLRGVRACGKDALDEHVVNAFLTEYRTEGTAAVLCLSQILSSSHLQSLKRRGFEDTM